MDALRHAPAAEAERRRAPAAHGGPGHSACVRPAPADRKPGRDASSLAKTCCWKTRSPCHVRARGRPARAPPPGQRPCPARRPARASSAEAAPRRHTFAHRGKLPSQRLPARHTHGHTHGPTHASARYWRGRGRGALTPSMSEGWSRPPRSRRTPSCHGCQHRQCLTSDFTRGSVKPRTPKRTPRPRAQAGALPPLRP